MNNLKKIIKENNFVFPDYNDINIVDVAKCLYAKCGYGGVNETKKIEELNHIIPDNKHYLLILSDGTGSNIINKLSYNSFIKRYKIRDINTVFPSTTGCVLTSLVTATYPEEHGIWGWFNYNRSLNRDYLPVLFSDRKTMNSLEEYEIESDEIYKVSSVLKHLNLKVNILFPSYIVESTYSKFVGNDKDRYSYNNFSEIVKLVKDICEKNDTSYTYLYLPDIDSIEHSNGVDSKITMTKLEEIDTLVNMLSDNKDLTIVFIADHGQTNINNDIVLNFNKYDKYFYAYPSIDFGTASYYVKSEYEDEFVKEFEADFHDEMFLFKTSEFVDNKLFGLGNMSDYARSNLGEYISICKKGCYLINTPDVKSYFGKIKGNHSGLTTDEMIVPLVVIDTNELNCD